MAYKAALFDLDDTLLDSVKMKWLQHRTIGARHFGIDITEETMAEVWGRPLSKMIEASYQGVAEVEVIRELLVASEPEFPKGVLDGAVKAIDSLSGAGIEVGIVTSAPTQHAVNDLIRHGFAAERLFCVRGYDQQEAHKPDPAVFTEPLLLLKEKGIDRSDVVYVGDLLVDMQAATRAGMDFVAVTTGIHTGDQFKSAGAKVVNPNVVEATDWILSQQAPAERGSVGS